MPAIQAVGRKKQARRFKISPFYLLLIGCLVLVLHATVWSVTYRTDADESNATERTLWNNADAGGPIHQNKNDGNDYKKPMASIMGRPELLRPLLKAHGARKETPTDPAPSTKTKPLSEPKAELRCGTREHLMSHKNQLEATCNSAKAFEAVNPYSRERFICGMKIGPESRLRVPHVCPEPSRLFKKVPPLDGNGMPPIDVVPGRMSKRLTDRDNFPCNVPCRNMGTSGQWFIQGTPWSFTYSMEAATYYEQLRVKNDAYTRDRYFATTSFRADIPLPYFSWAEYKIQEPPVDFDKVIHGASFIASNCGAMSGRDQVVQELQKYIRVDSLGSCIHNAPPPNGLHQWDSKNKLQREYLFHLAFENSKEDDYITEKLWGTYQSGTLPVYLGAPNVNEHAPPGSIISWHDFPNTEALGKYLQVVAANKTLFDSYHTWRSKPLPKSFTDKFNFTHTHSICRICRWAYAKMYGFGWDHNTQSVTELAIPRKVCIDEHSGFITHPFAEVWLGNDHARILDKSAVGTCTEIQTHASVVVGSRNRTVWVHDGIIDLEFAQVGSAATAYEIETGIGGGEWTALKPKHYQLQNGVSRITILTSWKSQNVELVGNDGRVRIGLAESDHSLIVRIIIEDLDTFHKRGTQQLYHFGKAMTQDFFEPIQYYAVE